MQTTTTHPILTSFETAVLECVAYSDLFDFPLTPDEVLRWLRVPATAGEVEAALESEALAALLARTGGYLTLQGREFLVARREDRRRSSAALQRAAKRYGRLIGRLPFVRMVAITGSLAVENAGPDDDLDYLIVTAPGRVWTVRAMLMALGRFASLSGVTLCPNYLLSETVLALPQRDFYTARELLQMRPVAGHATYRRMLASNPWWRDYLPNAAPYPPTPSPRSERYDTRSTTGASTRARPERVEGRETPEDARTTKLVRPGPVEGRGTPEDARPGFEPDSPSPRRERGRGREVARALEAVLRLPPFDALERWILARKGAELRRHAGGPETVFDETMCKGHAGSWRTRTQDRLEQRMWELRLRLQDSFDRADPDKLRDLSRSNGARPGDSSPVNGSSTPGSLDDGKPTPGGQTL